MEWRGVSCCIGFLFHFHTFPKSDHRVGTWSVLLKASKLMVHTFSSKGQQPRCSSEATRLLGLKANDEVPCYTWTCLHCFALGKLSAVLEVGLLPTSARILPLMNLQHWKMCLIQRLWNTATELYHKNILVLYFQKRVTLNLTNFHSLNKQEDHVEKNVSGDIVSERKFTWGMSLG